MLIKSIIVRVTMMLVLIKMVLNAEHHKDFGKIKTGLKKQILIDGFSSILDTGQVEGLQMMKGKLVDGKEL